MPIVPLAQRSRQSFVHDVHQVTYRRYCDSEINPDKGIRHGLIS